MWRRKRLEQDLDRELRYHVERRIDDMTKGGLSEAEARRQAAIEFGGVTQVKDEVRDTWTWAWLDALARDLRYAVRSLTRSWTFTLGAGSILALGIGANTALFSVVNTVLIRPLAYPDADRIVSVETRWTTDSRLDGEVSGPDFLDWQARTDLFALLAHTNGEDDVATVVGDRAEFTNFRYVSPDFFEVFGQRAAAGRLLTRRDALAGFDAPPRIAIVAYDWAERHFGSAEAAIGKPLKVYNMPMEIVGVAAPGFRYPSATSIWASAYPTDNENRGDQSYQVVGRLKPEIGIVAAQAALRSLTEESARRYSENRLKTVALSSLQDRLSQNVRRTLWVLMAAVGVVLLIACANIANLLLARSAHRAREIALRAALGAGRGRVIRQLLTENLVLTAVAATVGVVLAQLFLGALVKMAPPNLPRMEEVRIDAVVLGFAFALSVASTLIFGLMPAVTASRLDLSEVLRQTGSPRTAGGASRRVRAALVVAEVALSVMLLAAAGLLLRSFVVLNQVDLGFTTHRVLTAYTQYVVSNADDRRNRMSFYRDVLERIRAVPGVVAASGANFLPLGRETQPAVDYLVQGQADQAQGARPKAAFQVVTPDYFKTLDIPMRLGREFTNDDTPGRPPVAVINEALARSAFPGQSPIGQRIKTATMKDWMEIVGVAADTRWRDPSQPPPPELFVGSMQGRGGSLSLFVRLASDDPTIVQALDAVLRSTSATVPIRFETMDDLFASALAYPRLRTQLIAVFAGVAALLAAVGIFSVLAYIVGQRTGELAVRRAIGAGAGDVVRLVIGDGLRLVAVGLAIGLCGALAIARSLEGLLFEISPWDVGTYLGAVGVLGLAAMFATVLPALRAATIDPLIALRHQ